MTRTEQIIKNACALPKKAGKAEYIKHLEGKRLTRDQAIRAKCYECVGGDDTRPCKISTCSLTAFCQWTIKEDIAE